MFERRRVQVTFDVIDADERLLERGRVGLGERHAHHQRADQTGRMRDRDTGELRRGDAGLAERTLDHGRQQLEMRT